jgi:hypothetical protein
MEDVITLKLQPRFMDLDARTPLEVEFDIPPAEHFHVTKSYWPETLSLWVLHRLMLNPTE